MKIVIDIPEEMYKNLQKRSTEIQAEGYSLENSVLSGTPLPKGHGRLIDGDRFDVISYQHTSDDFDNGVMWLAKQIDNAPTIIEADTESEEKK